MIEVALSGGPEQHAQGAVDLEAGKAGDDPHLGVVGEKPVGGELAREQDRLGLAGAEPGNEVMNR
jgi:hypothetical protein